MGIRTLLSRTAPGVALPPASAFAADASTLRVPVPLTAALRHATADLRQRLARGRRPADPAGAGSGSGVTGSIGTGDLSAVTDPQTVTGIDCVGDLPAVPCLTGRTPTTGPHPGSAGHPGSADRPGNPDSPGTPKAPARTSRPWADRARGYLSLVLTLLPRPRPAHTTITVYIATTEPLSERPDGSAPYRRHGQDRRGPEPGAAP
ncbi:hypothetical protein [Streptomyces sp. NPDC057002]|uniref:hypothetical protein n=1 Tax=Streptomyces sp. NPDC057002 TaxID=3345992 RepID=UPI00362D510A